MAGRAARRRDRVRGGRGRGVGLGGVPFGVVVPGEHRPGTEQRGHSEDAPTTARCTVSGTSRPAAADPIRPPVTAPMLQMPWNALRIERP